MSVWSQYISWGDRQYPGIPSIHKRLFGRAVHIRCRPTRSSRNVQVTPAEPGEYPGATIVIIGEYMNQFCYVVSIKAQPSWLQLSRDDRQARWSDVRSIVEEYQGRVSFDYYDADAFHAAHSDMVLCNTNAVLDYHHMWDRIKDTRIFASGYYEITDVRMGIRGVHHG